MIIAIDPPNREMVGLSIPLWFVSFILARVAVSSAQSWPEMRLLHWCVFPPLLLGYLIILVALLIWPAVVVIILGLTPVFLDVSGWELMGQHYELPNQPNRIPPYWLMVGCASASAMLCWSLLVSLVANKKPQPFSRIFHPASPAAVQTTATYVLIVSLVTLGPVALSLAAVLSLTG